MFQNVAENYNFNLILNHFVSHLRKNCMSNYISDCKVEHNTLNLLHKVPLKYLKTVIMYKSMYVKNDDMKCYVWIYFTL